MTGGGLPWANYTSRDFETQVYA